MNIEFRQAKKDDLSAVREIMSETWSLDDDVHDRRAFKYYQNAYFYSYLANSNYCEVAVDGGTVVGFLLGRCDNIGRPRGFFGYKLKAAIARMHLLFMRGGREGLEIINKTVYVDKKLLRDHSDEFDGELCLFAVAKTHRKHGIGQILLSHYHDFMRQNNAKCYYLYTDTYCDVKFYEQNGFELVSLDTVDFGDEELPENDEGESPQLPKYMLYKYNLRKKNRHGNQSESPQSGK